MAEEATNTAPAEAPKAPESETPTNTEPAQATQQPVKEEAPKEGTLTLTDEQKRFIDANGGFEKVFEKAKSAIANPQKPAEEPKPEEKQPEQKPEEAPQQQPAGVPKGYISPREFYVDQYFKSLAKDKKYAPIADKISSGDVLKEMAAFNIKATDDNGNINDGMVRKFLDLKAQTVPATAPTAGATSVTPTVTYTDVGESITDRETAMKVINESGHPKHDEAMKFLREQIFGAPKKK